MKVELRPHTIIMPSYCPVAICMTRDIAKRIAEACGYTNYRIEVTTQRDVECMLAGHTPA